MMRPLLVLSAWTMAFAMVLVGAHTVASHSEEAAKPPAYLQTATYITVGKCKMCHAPLHQSWKTTAHGKLNTALPWEKDGKVPAPEVVYRHTTGYNADTKTWSEKGITCEACHGPGSEHFKASKAQRKLTILNPATLDTQGKKLSLCGRCHGQYTIDGQKYAAKYTPGQDLLATAGFKLDPVQPGKPMQQLNEFVTNQHYKKGLACETCHTSHAATATEHSLKKPVVQLCNDCHKDKDMATHAPKAAAGSTCATCHMPNGTHTFAKPGHGVDDKAHEGHND